jgi:hypothetical protein
VIAVDLVTVGIYEWEWRGFLFWSLIRLSYISLSFVFAFLLECVHMIVYELARPHRYLGS